MPSKLRLPKHRDAICSAGRTGLDFHVFHSQSWLESRSVAKLPSNGEPKRLSRRERQVLRLLVRGFSWQDVATKLRMPIADLERLHSNICGKLHLSGQQVVYDYAAAIGLVDRNGE